MPRKLTIGKSSKISIFQRKTGRWIVDWHDDHGARRSPSFATLKEAEAFQKQKPAELERHRGGKLPFAIAMKDGRPFTFAGLWENRKDPESGEWLRTCTIITGEPNELVA